MGHKMGEMCKNISLQKKNYIYAFFFSIKFFLSLKEKIRSNTSSQQIKKNAVFQPNLPPPCAYTIKKHNNLPRLMRVLMASA